MSPGRGADEQANDAEEVAILGHRGRRPPGRV